MSKAKRKSKPAAPESGYVGEGGPAFPTNWDSDAPGATLRDKFAAAALGAVVEATAGNWYSTDDDIAAWAWSLADAMIRHRHCSALAKAKSRKGRRR